MNEVWMREAIELSKGGFPAPNPHVGCVIVRDGQRVGRGFHVFAGGPHAEAVALKDAGNLAEGADVYVTLEPCNHTGRTPPCSQGLIGARVRRVYIANLDPNPVATGGVQTLEEAGIEVRTGILSEEAASANRQFFDSIRLGRPVVTIKAAASLDGKIALPTGESKWITGPEAREAAHRLRAECGAVLVGYRTVQADDPELTARIEGVVSQPLRVVLDPDNRLTGREKVFNEAAPTLHVTGRPLELTVLMTTLSSHKVRGVLVEGGAGTVRRFVEEGLADRLELFLAPKLLGEGLTWTEGLRFETLADTQKLEIESVVKVGPDIQVSATFSRR
jgi:diaminohydroxyphosphoribosylaminopyrimidine deaminase / 5-amino-6-(5-phosphoribosylamino)uracil reductase